jgi:sirohydrochlorin cobaltochelatase
MAEFFGLHAQREMGAGDPASFAREEALESQMRRWPRTPANDPFWAASVEMARLLEESCGLPVSVGFNEFCAPSVDEALDATAARAKRIVVVTPMLTRGGEHAEQEIPEAVERARHRHPGVRIDYAWPYDVNEVARFLAAQVGAVR